MTLPVEVFIFPSLGRNRLLLDHRIMGAFTAILHWQAELLYCRNQKDEISAQHKRMSQQRAPTPRHDAQCSVIALDGRAQALASDEEMLHTTPA